VADDQKDSLNQDEIDGMLNLGGGETPPLNNEASSVDVSPDSTDTVPDGESAGSADVRTPEIAEQLLSRAEADLESAIAPQLTADPPYAVGRDDAASYQFQEFDQLSDSETSELGVDAIKDVELDLCIELGRTELLIEEVLRLKEGSVVPLDKLAGDPVDIVVNGRLVARGEVLVLNDNFCVRVAEILTPDE